MRSLPAGLGAALARPLTTFARLWRVERPDGVVIGLTDHDRDLVVEGTTYLARGGMVPGAVDARLGLDVDGLDVSGYLDETALSAAAIARGGFDDAVVEVALADWSAPEAGRLLLARGRMGEITVTGSRWRAELRGLSQRLMQGIGTAYGPDCDADFADRRCGVAIDGPAWGPLTAKAAGDAVAVMPAGGPARRAVAQMAGTTGAVAPAWTAILGASLGDGSVTWVIGPAYEVEGVVATGDALFLTDPSRDEPAGWFDGGRLTILSGVMAGVEGDVAQGGAGMIVPARPLPEPPPPGTAYRLRVGCDRRIETCAGRFRNTLNFRGFPFVPDPGAVTRT